MQPPVEISGCPDNLVQLTQLGHARHTSLRRFIPALLGLRLIDPFGHHPCYRDPSLMEIPEHNRRTHGPALLCRPWPHASFRRRHARSFDTMAHSVEWLSPPKGLVLSKTSMRLVLSLILSRIWPGGACKYFKQTLSLCSCDLQIKIYSPLHQ